MVIARRLKPDETPQNRSRFTSLNHRPQGFAHASSLSGGLLDGSPVRHIEDGPYGGTPLTVGDELAGETITAPLDADGESWGTVRPLRPLPGADRLRSVPIKAVAPRKRILC